jgi:hypothetical protein
MTDHDDLDRVARVSAVEPLMVPTWAEVQADLATLSPERSRNVYPREESVDRVVGLLLPLLELSEASPEAEQLRQLLIDEPGIDTLTKLRSHLAVPGRPSKHRTPEIETVTRRLDARIDRLAIRNRYEDKEKDERV